MFQTVRLSIIRSSLLYTQQWYTRFVQKVSGLTTVHEVDKAYGVLTLSVFNIQGDPREPDIFKINSTQLFSK